MRIDFSALKRFKAIGVLGTFRLMLFAIAAFLFTALPALAHHPLEGRTPSTFFEGLLSGLAHPVLGLDHFVFVITVGLLAAAMERRLIVPIVFVLASLLGTGIHLMSIDLPLPELVISASVLLFGVLLALKERPKNQVVTALALIAGLFHGFAYGESIFGAAMGPLVAYLLGFAVIQLAIAAAAYQVGRQLFKKSSESSGLDLRFAGFIICGVGGTFVSTLIMESIFPA